MSWARITKDSWRNFDWTYWARSNLSWVLQWRWCLINVFFWRKWLWLRRWKRIAKIPIICFVICYFTSNWRWNCKTYRRGTLIGGRYWTFSLSSLRLPVNGQNGGTLHPSNLSRLIFLFACHKIMEIHYI